MYRYDIDIIDDRILADTRLVLPGRPVTPDPDEVPPALGPGIVDAITNAWLDAANAATSPLSEPNTGTFLWPLGAVHDTTSDVVTVPVTVDGVLAELRVGTIHSVDTYVSERNPDGFEVLRAHYVCADLWEQTPPDVVTCAESVGQLNVVASKGGRMIRAELYAPDGGERVVTLVMNAPIDDNGASITRVLLSIVEAHDLPST
jgi:hypothetical protein